MQDIVINPKWEFIDAVRAAWARYSGGVMGMSYRTTVLRTWGNVVGRSRALVGLNQFVQREGGVGNAASALGMSPTTLRALRRYFEGLPPEAVPSADLIDIALQRGENSSVEFKERIPSQVRDLAKEVAAFATSGGGLILVGVADDGTIIGFDDKKERVEGVMQLVKPSPRVKVELQHRGGLLLCAIFVEAGDDPLYWVDHRPYLRDGTLSRPAGPDEVVRLIQEG